MFQFLEGLTTVFTIAMDQAMLSQLLQALVENVSRQILDRLLRGEAVQELAISFRVEMRLLQMQFWVPMIILL